MKLTLGWVNVYPQCRFVFFFIFFWLVGGNSEGSVLEHYQEEEASNKQCLLKWDAFWQAGVSKQTWRTAVESHCVIAWQCILLPILMNPPESSFEILAHPLYSLSFAPSNSRPFSPLQETLRDLWFTSKQK